MGREAPTTLNGIRAGKYAFRGASVVVEVLILLVIAGPLVGALTPAVSPQNEVGLGIDLRSIDSQLQFLASSSTIGGPHTLSFHAFNRWFLPASVSLQLSLAVNGTTVYQTQRASATLAPFDSGTLDLTVDIPPGTISQLEGQTVAGGGSMTLQEDGFWSVTANLGQG